MKCLYRGLKPRLKSTFASLMIFALLFSFLGAISPATAAAATPADSLIVNIDNNGETTTVHTYTLAEMEALSGEDIVYYSSIDSMPAPVLTIARGVTLSSLVQDLNEKHNANITLSPDTLKSIKLHATDGWSATYSYDYLFGAPRNYYPQLVSCWDENSGLTGPGSDADPVALEPMFAVSSFQGRFLTDLDPGKMIGPGDQGSTTFRFCFGQTADEVAGTKMTTGRFGKYVYKMDIVMDIVPPESLPAPELTADSTDNAVGQSIDITFADDESWREAITEITVDGNALASGQYTITAGKINIAADVFTAAGDYVVTVQAAGYTDATVTQTMQDAAPTNGYFISEGRGNMLSISAGFWHSMALKNDGTVWTWGLNENGELGNGTTVNSCYPVQVVGLTDVKTIAAGMNHGAALKNDGTVWTWGQNKFGQLGNGTKENSSVPVQVVGLSDVKEISVKRNHMLALKNDGTVWAWGWNLFGQIGDGTTTSQPAPLQVAGLPDGIKHVIAGDSTSYVLAGDGMVWAWGAGFDGQLGNGQTPFSVSSPVQVTGLADVKYIYSASNTTMAIKSDGTAWVWGNNNRGLSFGTGTSGNSSVPIQISTITGVKLIKGGCALLEDGTVWTWGFGYHGALGNGSLADEPLPIKISDPAGIRELSTGSHRNLALKDDGTVWGWGINDYGQLGDENPENKLIPTQIKLAPQAVSPAPGAAPGSDLELTFTDDVAWRESITVISVDGTELAADKYTIAEGKISIDASIFDQAKEYSISIKAAGFLDAEVKVETGLAVDLMADTNNNFIGQPVKITFIDNETWRTAITGITVDGKPLTADEYEISAGNIIIAADVFTVAGEYMIAVHASGYSDAVVTQPMRESVVLTLDGTALESPITYIMNELKALPATTITSGDYTATGVTVEHLLGLTDVAIGDDWEIIFHMADGSQTKSYAAAKELVVAYEREGQVILDEYQGNIFSLRLLGTDLNWPYLQGISINEFTLTLSGNPTLEWVGEELSFDLTTLTLTAQDQSGQPYDLTGKDIVWSVNYGNNIASISDSNNSMLIIKNSKGGGKIGVSAAVGNATSNILELTVIDKFTSLTVTIDDNGDITTKVYLLSELEQMEIGKTRVAYTSVDSLPAPKFVAAEGILFEDLLELTEVPRDQIRSMMFVSTDGYVAGPRNKQGIELFFTEEQYYFPKIKECWNYNNPYNPLPGAEEGKQQVKPMLAFKSYTERFNDGPQWDLMDRGSSPRVCIGQITVDDITSGAFAKWVEKISISLLINCPVLTADSTNNIIGNAVELTFIDNEAWRKAITGITVNETALAADQYTVSAGNINIAASAFPAAGDYTVTVQANDYKDAVVTQTIKEAEAQQRYTVTPVEDDAYAIGTLNGLSTMTVNPGFSGMKYFGVGVAPVIGHEGLETAVFVHSEDGIQRSINATRADFDLVPFAQAGFNVDPGDVVKVFIVDVLTNAANNNPFVLQ